LPYLAGKRM